MRRLMKGRRRGEKGFTLIELLIVIAILGILVAIVIPNVTTFMTSGKIGAGRAEKSTLSVAVDGMMADAGVTAIAAVTGWQGAVANTPTVTVNAIVYNASDYVRRSPTKGTFSVAADGIVTCTAYPGLGVPELAKVNAP